MKDKEVRELKDLNLDEFDINVLTVFSHDFLPDLDLQIAPVSKSHFKTSVTSVDLCSNGAYSYFNQHLIKSPHSKP